MTARAVTSNESASSPEKPDEYVAFISYSHAAVDTVAAKRLHSAIETYVVPRGLRRSQGLPRRLGKVFLDEDELAAEPRLSEGLENALRRARHLILICSPRARTSQWVEQEVRYFQQLGRDDKIITVLIEGEPNIAFPDALFQSVAAPTPLSATTFQSAEPLAADVRDRPGMSARARWRDAILRVVATLLGCSYDDLRQRERQRQRRRYAAFATGLGLALLVLGFLASSIKQRRLGESRQLALQARQLSASKDYRGAIEVALRGVKRAHGFLVTEEGQEARDALVGALLGGAIEPSSETLFGPSIVAGGNMTALSPDGRFFAMEASSGDFGRVHVWNTSTKQESEQFAPETDEHGMSRWARRLVFSANSQFLMIGYADGTIVVRRMDGTGEKKTAKAVFRNFFKLDLDSLGRRLLVTSNGACAVYDLDSKAQPVDCNTSPLTFGRLSPSGRRLVTYGDGPAQLWDLDSSSKIRTLSEQRGTVMSAAFSPASDKLVTGSSDGSLMAWDSVDGHLIRSLVKHDERITYVGFAPDGRYLASGEGFSQAIYSHPDTPVEELRLYAIQDFNPPIVFSRTEKTLAHLSANYSVARVFDENGALKFRFASQPERPVTLHDVGTGQALSSPNSDILTDAAFGAGEALITIGFDSVRLWRILPGNLYTVLNTPGGIGACLSNEGNAVTILYPQKLQVVDLPSGASRDTTGLFPRFSSLKTHRVLASRPQGPAVFDCAGRELFDWTPASGLDFGVASDAFNAWTNFSQFGGWLKIAPVADRLLVRSSNDSSILMDFRTEMAREFSHESSGFFSDDGHYVVTVGEQRARLRNASSGESLCRIEGDVTSGIFAGNSRKVVLGGRDGSVRVVEVPSCQQIFKDGLHSKPIRNVMFDRMERVVSIDEGGILIARDTAGKERLRLQLAADHTSVANDSVNQLISYGSAGVPVLWNLADGTFRALDATAGAVLSVAFQPGGTLIAVRSMDGKVSIWDSENGLLLTTFQASPRGGETMGFSGDGSEFSVACTSDESTSILRLPGSSELTTIAERVLSGP